MLNVAIRKRYSGTPGEQRAQMSAAYSLFSLGVCVTTRLKDYEGDEL